LRSGKQLEVLWGVRVGVNSEKNHDMHVDALPSDDEPQKKSKESKPPSPKSYMPPLPFPQ